MDNATLDFRPDGDTRLATRDVVKTGELPAVSRAVCLPWRDSH